MLPLLLVGVFGSVLPGAAEAATSDHVPKPVNVEVDVRESETELHVLIDEFLFRHWFSLDPTLIPDLDPELKGEWGQFGVRIVEWLDIHFPVQVDGVQVIPVIKDLEWQEGFDLNDFLNYAGITVKYPTKSRPQKLEFVWSRYDSEDGYPLESVYMILAASDDFRIIRFREDDPVQSWSPPQARPVIDPELVAPGIRAPWFLLDLVPVFCACVGLYIVWKSRKFTVGTVAGVLICGGMALITLGATVVEVRPPWVSPIQLPEEAEAGALFETLHRNIYRAFDYDDEGQIYDLLARSVSGDLLKKTYDEIHESLMMKLEEAAICEIRSVRTIDTEVQLPAMAEEPAFQVLSTWEVIGTVKHWGHGHWRKNLSRALYDVSWVEGTGWRIDGVEVIEQRRLDDGQESVK
ncbi:MAG: hypothetical protein VX764_08615 [Planctomycetota bacterium]|nr:hypothetical protein [Planctomycetota bacterium]